MTNIVIERIPRKECGYWCEKGRLTHVVKFELVPIGETITLAEGCADCMQTYAEKVKTALFGTTA